MGIVANGFGVFEHADYVVAGVVKDPVAEAWRLAGWMMNGWWVVLRMELTGFAGRLSICLALVEVRVEDSRLRGDTQGRVEHRRWRSLALKEDGHDPWLQLGRVGVDKLVKIVC